MVKNKIVIIPIVLILVILGCIVFLESKYQQCKPIIAQKVIATAVTNSCEYYETKVNNKDTNIKLYADYTNVYEIDASLIKGYNGIACNKNAFISADLPKFAKKYVAYHEYLHTQGDTNETSVNYKAGIKEPLGFVQTIAYSINLNLQSKSFDTCSLAGIWKIFKVYFLGDTYTDLFTSYSSQGETTWK